MADVFRLTFALDLLNGPTSKLDHRALAIMLECLTELDALWLAENPDAPLLYDSHVHYMEEPPGQEDWQDVPTCLRMGVADCEDLCAWRAAELRVRFGVDARPVFTEKKRADGGSLYHILVEFPDGTIEDPSKLRGMR